MDFANKVSFKALAKRGRMVLTASNLAAQALSFLGGLIIARTVGPVGRGNVAIVAVYNEASTTAMGLGVPAAVANKAAGSTRDDTSQAEGELIGAALRIALWSMPVAIAVAFLVDRFMLDGVPRSIAVLVFAAISATPLFNTVPIACRMLLVARQQLTLLAVATLAPMALRVVALAVLALLDELTAVSAASVILVSGWLANFVTWLLVRVRPRSGGSATSLLKFGVQTIPSSLATVTNSRLDQLLMVPLLSTRDLGIYAVAVGVAFVPVNIGSALALSAYREAARDSGERVATTLRVRQAAKFIFLSGLVSALGAWLLLEPLYGAAFSASRVPALFVIAGSVGVGVSLVLIQISNAAGRPSVGSWSSTTALVVTIVGLAVALPRYGVNGAAAVSFAAYLTQAGVAYRLARKHGLVASLVKRSPSQSAGTSSTL